ncbi:leucyl aminopeptidase family protein [Sanguibacter sp. A247]|uniref:leucyl aminopeptidase family protein n=1 Tax=unclassified Sanguibacter TaxID=2645534 RepID=UPI003FD7233D
MPDTTPALDHALPGLAALDALTVMASADATPVDAIGYLVPDGDSLPPDAGIDLATLEAAGLEPKHGATILVPQPHGPDTVVVRLGPAADLTVARLRDAAAAFVRAVPRRARLALATPLDDLDVDRADALAALVEGAVLARYRFATYRTSPPDVSLDVLALRVGVGGDDDAAIAHALRGVRASVVARDLANTPATDLTAQRLGEIATALGERFGFDVSIADKAELIELGCGGLLGVNRGSVDEPRMIRLRYVPDGNPTGLLGFIGKGIMYDSGGISLKPSDPMHLLMKMDMGGAAAVLGAFTALRDAGTPNEVRGWLMCTDNMPSGSALKLGDILVARDGTTIEVKNTDAEGRLVMSDAFALAVEADVDAIVDVATLTGSALVSLGPRVAALLGNDVDILSIVEDAAEVTGERVWQLPLERDYRPQLDSTIADISNLGGPYAGAITAALFLDHFTRGTPWAHLDIAGTMQVEKDESWRSAGATGFGARILLDVAGRFTTDDDATQ